MVGTCCASWIWNANQRIQGGLIESGLTLALVVAILLRVGGTEQVAANQRFELDLHEWVSACTDSARGIPSWIQRTKTFRAQGHFEILAAFANRVWVCRGVCWTLWDAQVVGIWSLEESRNALAVISWNALVIVVEEIRNTESVGVRTLVTLANCFTYQGYWPNCGVDAWTSLNLG